MAAKMSNARRSNVDINEFKVNDFFLHLNFVNKKMVVLFIINFV